MHFRVCCGAALVGLAQSFHLPSGLTAGLNLVNARHPPNTGFTTLSRRPSLGMSVMAIEGAQAAFDAIMLSDAASTLLVPLGGQGSDIAGVVQDSLGAVQDSLGAAADQLGSIAGPEGVAGEAVSAAKEQLSGTVGTVASSVAGLKGQIVEQASSLGASVLTPLRGAAQGVAQGVQGQISQALTPINSLLGWVVHQLGTAADEVVGEEQAVVGKLTEVVSALEKVATPRACFNFENIAVAPLWLGMVLQPNRDITKKVMTSYVPVVVLCLVYTWLTFEALQDPVLAEGFSNVADLGKLSKSFANEPAGAVLWAHILAGDLFVGRWVYLDGQRNGVFTRHSLALAYFFGPIGVLSHLLTRGLVRIFKWDVQDIIAAGAATGGNQAAPRPLRALPPAAPVKPEPQLLGSARVRPTMVTQRATKAVLQEARSEATDIIGRANAQAADIKAEAEAIASPEGATGKGATAKTSTPRATDAESAVKQAVQQESSSA